MHVVNFAQYFKQKKCTSVYCIQEEVWYTQERCASLLSSMPADCDMKCPVHTHDTFFIIRNSTVLSEVIDILAWYAAIDLILKTLYGFLYTIYSF